MNKIFKDFSLSEKSKILFSSIFICTIIIYLCATELIFYPNWVIFLFIFFFIYAFYCELENSYYFIFGLFFIFLSFVFLILRITNIWLRFLISSLPLFIFGLVNPIILSFKNRLENKFGKNIIKYFFIFVLFFVIIIYMLFILRQFKGINLSSKYYSEGYNLYEEKDFVSAIDFLEKSVELNNKNYKALSLLGRAYLKEKDFENSKKFLVNTLKIKPYYFDAIIALASAYDKSEDLENAIKYYEKAKELRDFDFGAHFGMGRVLYKKGDLDKSVDELITANTLYSKKFELHYILGKIYYEKEEYEKALTQFEICNQLKKPEELEIPDGEGVEDFIKKTNMKKEK